MQGKKLHHHVDQLQHMMNEHLFHWKFMEDASFSSSHLFDCDQLPYTVNAVINALGVYLGPFWVEEGGGRLLRP